MSKCRITYIKYFEYSIIVILSLLTIAGITNSIFDHTEHEQIRRASMMWGTLFGVCLMVQILNHIMKNGPLMKIVSVLYSGAAIFLIYSAFDFALRGEIFFPASLAVVAILFSLYAAFLFKESLAR